MNLERLYLDYNATSPLSQSVLDWLKSGDVLFANPASQHSSGKASRKVINEARAKIYKTFNLTEKEAKLFFHSGATEGIHTFAYSFSEMTRRSNKKLLICFSEIDHPSTLALGEKYFGPHVEVLKLLRDDNLHYRHDDNLQTLKKKKDEDPDLIILYHHLWIHNETGIVSSIGELEKFKSIPDLYLHIDAVQVPGKIPAWRELTCGDIWTYSAHKFGALKGIGFSFFKVNMPFYPLFTGGGQQSALRSGTENVQGVMSIALALEDLKKVDPVKTLIKRNQFAEFMRQNLDGLGEVIDDDEVASNTIYFYLNELTSDIALALFDLNGLEISAGSACSSGAAKASAVLIQMGKNEVSKNGLRISMSFDPSPKELEALKVIFSKTIAKLRNLLPETR